MSIAQYISNANNITLAYMYQKPQQGKEEYPEIVFLSGFRSDMRGTKATILADFAERMGYGFLRLDYSGHGESGGDFKELCLSDWIADARHVISNTIPTDKPLIIVGSSMGGWIGLKLLTEMGKRQTSFVGLAPAADFTEKLTPIRYDDKNQSLLKSQGYVEMSCDYEPDSDPYIITQKFLEDGDSHSIMNDVIPYSGPVRILQGMLDDDVPFKHNLVLTELLTSENVVLNLIKDGDHRLSRPSDLLRLLGTVGEMMQLMYENIGGND